MVAGAGRARRWRSAAAPAGRWTSPARCGHDDVLVALCRHRGAGFGERRAKPATRPRQGVPRGFAAAGVAAQGIRAVGPRSLAGVADADATALSAAAGAAAVA